MGCAQAKEKTQGEIIEANKYLSQPASRTRSAESGDSGIEVINISSEEEAGSSNLEDERKLNAKKHTGGNGMLQPALCIRDGTGQDFLDPTRPVNFKIIAV